MTRLLPLLTLLLLLPTPAFATWSVIALDQKTGQVVVSSATCVTQERLEGFPAKDLRDIQAIVAPGVGVAVAQAGVDRTRAIIAMLKADPSIDSRQFAIVDMKGRSAGFSGQKNGQASLDRQGQVPGTGIYYSIQGNILKSDAVVESAVQALVNARGDLTDRVMAAMEEADARGGDSRCTCETDPKPGEGVACDGRTSYVAYILGADKSDPSGESYNDGRYAVYISVTNRDIAKHENANPVKTLRMRYDAWKKRSR
jgi:uncharacterized Ntn-hydrolase superfamily protein